MTCTRWLQSVAATALLTIPLCALATPPSTSARKAEKKMLLQRIQEIQGILQKTVSERGQLKAINRQVEANAELISAISGEVAQLDQKIQQKQEAMSRLSQDLKQLEQEYRTMVYMGSKTLHDMHQLMFVLATSSFQQLVLQLQQVKQYTRIRRQHFVEIAKIRSLLQTQHQRATNRKKKRERLLQHRQKERARLHSLQQKQARLVQKLSRQQQQLKRELTQRNKEVKRLNKLIDSALRAPQPPKQRSAPAPKSKTPFHTKKGQLPWPVKQGFINSRFGIGPHPILRNVQIENLGIDIQTQPGAEAYVVSEGIVKAIVVLPGMNHVVIVQHGNYHTVYAKLERVVVKKGQQIHAQTAIGTVATDTQGVTELQLQLWHGMHKLNPAAWLQKR